MLPNTPSDHYRLVKASQCSSYTYASKYTPDVYRLVKTSQCPSYTCASKYIPDNLVSDDISIKQTQNICIAFIQCWTNVEDVGPTLYKCFTNILCLLGMLIIHMCSPSQTQITRTKTYNLIWTLISNIKLLWDESG